MGRMSPPVQEALSALERLQADAYRRGWQDAMNAVSGFIAASRQGPADSSQSASPRPEARESRPPSPRGPNRDSVPNHILRGLATGPTEEADLVAYVQGEKPGESRENIRRAIRRLVTAGRLIRIGSRVAIPGAQPDLGVAEMPEPPVATEGSGLFEVSDQEEVDAAA